MTNKPTYDELFRVLKGITIVLEDQAAREFLNCARDKQTGKGLYDLAVELTRDKEEG